MYRVFISHAHEEHHALYNSLVTRFGQQRFDWQDVSVPEQRRYGFNEQLPEDEIRRRLGSQLMQADVVLVIAKPIVGRREWLKWELRCAEYLGIPIVALWRRQVDLRVSKYALEKSTRQVDTWNILSIMRAIRETATGAPQRDPVDLERLVADLPLTGGDDDVIRPLPPPSDVASEGLALLEELALTGDEQVYSPEETPKEVLSPVLVNSGERPPAVPVEEALKKLDGLPGGAADENPKDVVARSEPHERPMGLRWRWSGDFA